MRTSLDTIYADGFWSKLRDIFWVKNDSSQYLPIVFSRNTVKNRYGILYSHINTRTNIASIFPVVFLCKDRDDDAIKATIRHEVIHYLLAIHYQCHNDSSALFWLICDLFDGQAYVPLDPKSDLIYKTARVYLAEVYKLYTESKCMSVALNISLMLAAIDEAENNDFPDIEQLKTSLVICLDAAKQKVGSAQRKSLPNDDQ